jgi:outer membrane protein
MLLNVNARLYLSFAMTLLLGARTAQGITLEEAIAQALQKNRALRMAGIRVGQRAEELAAQKTRRLPSASVVATLGVSLTRADVTFQRGALGEFPATGPIPENEIKVGIPRQISGFSYSQFALPLTQQIRIGAAIEGARLEEGVAKAERARTEQEVVAQVRQLYFALLSADAALKAAQANLELAREVERLAGEGVKAGTTLPADRGEAAARRVRSEAALSGVQVEREDLREQFNVLLGRSIDEAAEVAPPADALVELTQKQVQERAALARPEVEAARLRVRQAETAVKEKRAELIPDISLTVQHFGFQNTGNLAPSNYAVAGFQLNWEPWDWGRRRREARALQSQADAAKLAAEETSQQVRRQASQALRAWEQAQRETAAAEAAVEAARVSVRVNRERYEQQAALLRSLLEAQATFESAQAQQVRALAARGTAWANLQLAMGNQ